MTRSPSREDASASEQLPDWLCSDATYEPIADKESFLRKNLLALARTLAALRAEPAWIAHASPADRFLARISPSIRLLGILTLVLCVGLARNMAFVWLLLAACLCRCALLPARQLPKMLVPAVVASLLAVLVNLPALLFGQASAPVRMASKTFVTVALVTNLAQTIGSDGMVAALRGIGLPAQVAMVVDLALRDIVILGESATSLSEALSLRSVGSNRDKTSSAAGVMGVVFLRAQRVATARAEAMELRGYAGDWSDARRRMSAGVAELAYVGTLIAVVAGFAYLEGALA